MSYENEMKQAFRQLGPLGEREACEIAATADAEIAALRAELSRAVKLLQRFEKFYGKPTPTLRDDVHDFLAERGGEV